MFTVMNNISTEYLRNGILEIINKEGYSPDELSNISGVSNVTIYKILNLKTKFTQRAIIRKIANATNREFVISGDKVIFRKKETEQVLDDKPNKNEQKLLDIFRAASEEEQDELLSFLENACKLIERGRQKRNNE